MKGLEGEFLTNFISESDKEKIMAGDIQKNILEMSKLIDVLYKVCYTSCVKGDYELSKFARMMYRKLQEMEVKTLKMVFRIKVNDSERMVLLGIIDGIMDIANTSLSLLQFLDYKKEFLKDFKGLVDLKEGKSFVGKKRSEVGGIAIIRKGKIIFSDTVIKPDDKVLIQT